jgi:hypothetical protein
MQYSPKLKKMIEQIRQILIENDCAGSVVLHTPGFSEYLNHIAPSYSCAKIKDGAVKVKLVTAEVGKDKAKEIATNTLNMFYHLAKWTATHDMMYMELEEMLKAKWNGEHLQGGSGHSSHEQQNN